MPGAASKHSPGLCHLIASAEYFPGHTVGVVSALGVRHESMLPTVTIPIFCSRRSLRGMLNVQNKSPGIRLHFACDDQPEYRSCHLKCKTGQVFSDCDTIHASDSSSVSLSSRANIAAEKLSNF